MAWQAQVEHKDPPAESPLFAQASEEPAVSLPKHGLLCTNHLNLAYMLSCGLLMPPSGFGEKYYRDPLGYYPGWIPLFPRSVFADSLDLATSEASHLRPCLARVRLDLLSGRALALRDSFEEIEFPGGCRSDDRAYLIPAPLPVHWIDRILYRSAEDRAASEADAHEFGNVPLEDFPRKLDKQRFTAAQRDAWPESRDIPAFEPSLAVVQTAGAIVAMLLHLGNRGDFSVDACRLAFDPRDQDAPTPAIPLLRPLRSWLLEGIAPAYGVNNRASNGQAAVHEAQCRIFWQAVDRLTQWRGSGSAGSAEEVLIGHLRQGSQGFQNALRRKFLALADALEGMTGFGDLEPTAVLRQHPTPFSRAMTLFSVCESCADLIEFRHPLLTEADWLAAAILFAARDGWERLPLSVRQIPGLSESVAYRMANMAHSLMHSGVRLGDPPARCRPLRELFSASPEWDSRQRDAAMVLAGESGWDCVQTTISLGRGEYRLRVSSEDVQLVLRGEPKAVYTEIDRNRFCEFMASERIPVKLEARVRQMLDA